eukprot:GILK01006405.1.p1 GENE.GILK01006405.1~~GILK01006405.1.p1  ORF type:complete len:982 (+),score=212.98 GILK01006405.1:73-3018(+)
METGEQLDLVHQAANEFANGGAVAARVDEVEATEDVSSNEQEQILSVPATPSQSTVNAFAAAAPQLEFEDWAKVDGQMVSYITEYLTYRGFNTVTEHLKVELLKNAALAAIKHVPSKSSINNKQNSVTSLLSAFENGDRDSFFAVWNSVLPSAMRKDDMVADKIEFYAHIHFAIYPLQAHSQLSNGSSTSPSVKERMSSFKEFLDSKGSDLSRTTEFLAYYALPYVNSPKDHPSFKQLFLPDWVSEVRSRLVNFLESAIPDLPVPTLYQMYSAYQGAQFIDAPSPVLESVKQQLAEAERREQVLRTAVATREEKWRAFTKDILGVGIDLFHTLNRQRNGVPVPEDYLRRAQIKLSRCNELLDGADRKSGQPPSSSPSSSLLQHSLSTVSSVGSLENGSFVPQQGASIVSFATTTSDHPSASTVSNRLVTSANGYPSQLQRPQTSTSPQMGQSAANPQMPKTHKFYPPSLAAVDFNKIKLALNSATVQDNDKCSLIQALRWRISRSRAGKVRRGHLSAFIANDLLESAVNSEDSPSLLHAMLEQSSRRVTECAVRFINVLASECSGRSYLLKSDVIIELLAKVLVSEPTDSALRQNALGALQKFSLRRKPQSMMIDLDLISWITNALRDVESLSEYSLEYTTALLMNLSLRSSGKRKCEDLQLDVLGVLNNLLEHESPPVRTYVNGTLYSVLSRPSLRDKAKSMGMEEILESLMSHSAEQFKRQIQYIMEQLRSEEVDDAASEEGDDDDEVDEDEEDGDIIEEEEDDLPIYDSNNQSGEQLLSMLYGASDAEAKRQLAQTEREKEPLKRAPIPLQSGRPAGHPRKSIRENIQAMPLQRPTTPATKLNKSEPESRPRTGELSNVTTSFVPLPEELQSKPRLARTPHNNSRLHDETSPSLNSSANMGNEMPADSGAVSDQEHIETSDGAPVVANGPPAARKNKSRERVPVEPEYQMAFASRAQLTRTPPAGASRIPRPLPGQRK